MRVRISSALGRAAGSIRNRLSRQALILLYHRVAEVDSDPWQLSVTPGHFQQQLQVLSKYAHVMPLHKLPAAIKEARLPRRAVVVTFDDGYADNLLNAKPLLEKYEIPATVFVATGYTGQDREFWWDELERLLLEPGTLPDTLSVSLNGNNFFGELGREFYYSETSCQSNRQWRAWQTDNLSSRQSLYLSLWRFMHPMPEGERQQFRRLLLEWAGVESSARSTHRALSAEELIELTESGLVEVGCHTVTHSQLSALGRAWQRKEIFESKSHLEEILGQPVTSFAYPYGRECDYTGETISLVREAGFDCACSTSRGVVTRHADCFQLPRLQVEDMDGEAFARLLRAWFNN